MSAEPTITSVEHEGFTVTTNTGGTPEQVTEALRGDKPAEEKDLSKAASELGKKGGEAAAKARKAKPIKEKAKDDGDADQGADLAGKDRDGESGVEGDAEPEATKEAKKDNPRHDAQARIRELAEERREAKDRAERAERQAQEFQSRLERLERERAQPNEPERQARGGQTAPDDDPEPDEGDFEVHKDFVKATSQWAARQAKKELYRELQAHSYASQQARELNATVEGFREQLKKASQSDPGLMEQIRSVGTQIGLPSRLLPQGQRPTSSNWIADDLFSAPESAPALLRYLSEHEDEFQRIATLSSPRAITRELAKIQVTLESGSDAAIAGTSSGRAVSKANPPVTPVTGSPSVASGNQGPRPGEDFDAWYTRTGKNQKR